MVHSIKHEDLSLLDNNPLKREKKIIKEEGGGEEAGVHTSISALQDGSHSVAQAAFKLESFCLSLPSGIVGMHARACPSNKLVIRSAQPRPY